MSQMLTIARREMSALFYSPIGYVVLGLFAFTASMLFLPSFGTGMPASLRMTFEGLVWTLMLLAPPISMRLISDEFRNGTIETMMTSPLSDTQFVVGKWLGAMGFFAVTLALVVGMLLAVLMMHSRPEPGMLTAQVVGLLLVGGLYLAIGTAASAATENQIIAYLVTAFIIGLLSIAMYFLPQASFVTQWMASTFFYLNVNRQFEEFNKGVIDTSNLVYFTSGIAMFLFIAVKLVESKRWR